MFTSCPQVYTPNIGVGHDPWQVTDGGLGDLDGVENGSVETSWFVDPDDSAGSVFELTATGLAPGSQAQTTFTDSQEDYEHWANDLGEVMGNASLASQQLKLTTAEIRRSPWKILYRPSVDELDHELLYEAARSFALAATDLKGASESVRRVLDNHAAQIDQAAFTRLERNLTDSLQNYERAQQELFEVLVVESTP